MGLKHQTTPSTAMPTEVDLDELEQALDWVSASSTMEASAHVCRRSGRVYLVGPDGPFEGESPDPMADDPEYVAVPHKTQLDLGRTLVLQFIESAAPALRAEVVDMFRHRGAYSRFKSMLQRHGLLDGWFGYESAATKNALCQWAREEGFVVRSASSVG